jgi:hypothetical protein
MDGALAEMIGRMTVRDLERALASSERVGDRELIAVLAERLARPPHAIAPDQPAPA